MASLTLFIAPALLIAATLGMRPLRKWLESLASQGEGQEHAIEAFQSYASKFLRETDPVKDAGIRRIIPWAGMRMVQGTSLIDQMVYHRTAGTGVSSSAAVDEFDRLSDEAKHSLAHALGLALCVSSYQSRFRREHYAAMLAWILSKPSGEVKEPQQVVYRYGAMALDQNLNRAHA